MVLPVRFPPAPSESSASYLSRLARANDCTLKHVRDLVDAGSGAANAPARRASLQQLVKEPLRRTFGSPGDTRAVRRLIEPALMSNGATWTCPECDQHAITAARPATYLQFACTTHRRFLTPTVTANAAPPPAEEFLLLQHRLNAALADFALNPSASHAVPTAIALIETLSDMVDGMSLDAAMPLHDHARFIGDLHEWARKPDAQTVGRLLRTVWPMVESNPMAYLTSTYLDQIHQWHASHPDPVIRRHGFRPWELRELFDTLDLGRQVAALIHTHGVTADDVPTMLRCENDSFPLDLGVPRSEADVWNLRTLACVIVFELVDDIELEQGAPKALDASRSHRRSFNADFLRAHQNPHVLDTLPHIRRIIRALEPGHQYANIDGRIGLSNRKLAQLLPRHRGALVDTSLVEVWLWVHRAHGTEAMTTLPYESLPRLKKFNTSLSGEEKLDLLDFQDHLLAELADRDSITPASGATTDPTPSSTREAERA